MQFSRKKCMEKLGRPCGPILGRFSTFSIQMEQVDYLYRICTCTVYEYCTSTCTGTEYRYVRRTGTDIQDTELLVLYGVLYDYGDCVATSVQYDK